MRTMVAAFVIGAVALGADALAGVGDKITGGAESVESSGIAFSVTGNAIQMVDRAGNPTGLKGSVQYSREDPDGSALIVHSPAQCHFISADGLEAEIAGPATVHENSVGEITDDWFVLGIQENGTGAGDRVRAGFIEAGYSCDGSFVAGCAAGGCPGNVLEGEFKIRPAE